jgi:MFS family permease
LIFGVKEIYGFSKFATSIIPLPFMYLPEGLADPYRSYGFNFFFPTLVQGLGYGDENTSLLLTAPPYFLGAIVSFCVSWNSDRIKERGFHITCALGAAATGFIITLATTNLDARYAASFLYAPGSFSANALVYAWAVSTLSSTPEKRAACGAIVNIFGHIVGPLLRSTRR